MSQIVTVLDGRFMLNKQQVHDYLSERFNFPDYYGKNLDALYDLMSTYHQEEKLIVLLIYSEFMLDQLGQYGHNLISTFEDAARVNPKLDFRMKNYIYIDESEDFLNA